MSTPGAAFYFYSAIAISQHIFGNGKFSIPAREKRSKNHTAAYFHMHKVESASGELTEHILFVFSLSFQHLLFPSLVLFIYFSLAATAAASSWCFTVFNSLPKMVNIREERCQHDDVVSGVADMHFIVNATNESILKLRIDVNRFLGRVRINHFPFYVYGNQMVFGRLTQSTPAPNRRFTKK